MDIEGCFKPIIPISHKEKEVIDLVNLTILKGLPVSIAQDENYRKLSSSDCNFSKVTVGNAIFSMVEIVEGKIGADMNESVRRSILSDGWTKCGTHCVGLFDCRMKKNS